MKMNHGEAKKTICDLGKKLGYVSFMEVEAEPGATIDVVWLDKVYETMYGQGAPKPKLWEKLSLATVAFEVENSYELPAQIRNDVSHLEMTGASLGVIVIPSRKEIQEWIHNHPSTSTRRGKGRAWGISFEQDIENVRRSVRSSSRVVVLPLNEIEAIRTRSTSA